MAHLIESTGHRDLVEHVHAARNLARIPDLIDIPGLVEWLEANGLSLDDASRIQPSYQCYPPSECVCGNPPDGIVEAEYSAPTPGGDATFTVTAVYGSTPGFAVGDVTTYTSRRSSPYFERDLLLIRSGSVQEAIEVTSDDVVWPPCDPTIVSNPGLLPKEVFIDASLASDCEGKLKAYSPAWVDDAACAGGGQGSQGGYDSSGGGGGGYVRTTPTSRDGCSTSPATVEPHGVAILLFAAGMTFVAGRRLARRRR